MKANEVVALFLVVLCSISIGVILYFKVKGNLLAVVSELIALAEATGLTGAEKMAQVVNGLMELVPMVLRKVLTAEKLEVIAQYVFDWMRQYAEEYMSRKAQAESSQENTVTENVN